jgi:hypothetical protein
MARGDAPDFTPEERLFEDPKSPFELVWKRIVERH